MAKKPSKGTKGAATKPKAPAAPAEPPAAHQPYGSGGIRWAHRSDVGHIEGAVYEARFTEEAWEKFSNEKDPTKKTGIIGRRMHIMAGVDVPSKAGLKDAFAQDLETIFRICNGIDLKGSRGPTIEEVADKHGKGSGGE